MNSYMDYEVVFQTSPLNIKLLLLLMWMYTCLFVHMHIWHHGFHVEVRLHALEVSSLYSIMCVPSIKLM